MLISDIKDPALRELALERKSEYGGVSAYLDQAFLWDKTEEGDSFWNSVNTGVIKHLDKGTPKPKISLESVIEALKRIEDKLDQLLAPIQDQPVSKARFSIQDLADGKCAVINDGTVEQLQRVLAAAFPKSDKDVIGSWKYYFAYKTGWACNDVTPLFIQPVKDFL